MVDRAAVQSAMNRLLEAGGSSAVSVGPGGAGLHHLEEGSGQPVVLLHGGSGGGANWFRLLAPLSRTFRVLAPDLPGFGLSPHIEPVRPLGSAAAGVLHLWLEEHDIAGAILAGTSFGGLAALRLALRSPGRVAGLLLLDAAGLGREIHPAVRIAALPGLTRLGVAPTRRGTRALFRLLLTSDRSAFPPGQQEALIRYLHESARAAGTPYLAATLRAFATPRGQREVATPAELAALQCPVSFVWGALDRFLPVAHARAAARHCAEASTVIVPGAGHSPNWERPHAVIDAIHDLAARARR
jgi:pimeloyl-ACP methyl ester carboxylesterase